MPFGLCNAPATFQRLMDKLFSTRLLIDLNVYLDDIVMHNDDEESHLDNIRRTLRTLISAKLKCKPRKCKIFQKKNYLFRLRGF